MINSIGNQDEEDQSQTIGIDSFIIEEKNC